MFFGEGWGREGAEHGLPKKTGKEGGDGGGGVFTPGVA